MTAFLNVTEASAIKDFDGNRRTINVDKIVSYYPNSKGLNGATVLVVECGSKTESVTVYEDVISIEKLFRQWNLKLNPWKPGAKDAWQLKHTTVTSLSNSPGDGQMPTEAKFSIYEGQED